MDLNIIIVAALNFIIALIGTLAYSVRIVGVRTGKIAISFALFNALTLISSTANVFQLPKLTKYVE
ncbi:MAG: lipid II flippase family protein, partial [Ruminiclostridium sp.]